MGEEEDQPAREGVHVNTRFLPRLGGAFVFGFSHA